MATTGTSQFLSFTFDWDRDELHCEGVSIKLRPKTLALLRVFLERPGELLTKDELTRLVWPDVAVTDVVVNVCVNELRRAFGETAAEPHCLATVHRRGFRFIAPITRSHRPRLAESVGKLGEADLFVGRDAELETLRQCWQRSRAGQFQLAIISGDSGVGKTSLVNHFFTQLAGETEGLVIGRGHCLDLHAVAEPFLPVLEALRAICAGAAAARAGELLRAHAPSWAVLLGIDGRLEGERATGERGQASMVREIIAALRALAEEMPLVLALKDLHWSDPSTIDLVLALAQQRPARLFVVTTLRPADAILQGYPRRLLRLAAAGTSQVREVQLELLGEDAVRLYLERRFGDAEIAAALASDVAARTDGNPLFMIALVEHLMDQGVLQRDGDRWRMGRPLGEIAEQIPPSVTRLLREQIAELDARERAALEAACIAGQSFASQTVAAGMECGLEEAERLCADLAERRRFLIDDGAVEWPDGTVGEGYRFQHMIYRQVVEGSLTGGRRQALHLRIGSRLERGHGERSREIAGALAVHFHAGGDLERAFKYSRLAGRRAMDRSAYQEAIDHMRAAHSVLLRLPQSEDRDRDELRLLAYLGPLLAAVRGVEDPEAAALASRLRELARRTQQQFAQLASYARSTVIWRTRGEIAIADAVAREVLLLAEELGEEPLLMSAHFLIGGNRFHCADFETAKRHFEIALEIADRRQDVAGNLILEGIAAATRCQLAVTLLLSGRSDAALDAVESALSRHGTSELPVVRATLGVLAAWVFVLLHDIDRVEALVSPAVDCQPPIALWSAVAQIMRGWVQVQRGRIEAGFADVEIGFGEYLASQGEASTFDYQVLRADTYLRAGRHGEAMLVVDQGMETLARYKQVYFAPEMYRIRGELLAAEPIRSGVAAEQCWQEGLALARAQMAHAFELRLALRLARAMMADGRESAAGDLLRPALARVEPGGESGDVAEARRLLAAME